MYAEKAIEVRDDKVARRQDKRSHSLYDEFVTGLHAVAVVDETYQVDNQSAKRHEYRRDTKHELTASHQDLYP